MKFSLSGGYEYFPHTHAGQDNGYALGAEIDYFLTNRFYLSGTLHTGHNNGRSGKYNNSGDEMKAPIHEYTGVLGAGINLIDCSHHVVYVQGGIGYSRINNEIPQITYLQDKENTALLSTKDNYSDKVTGLLSAGYDFKLTEKWSIGLNYAAWMIPSQIRSSVNLKVSFSVGH